MKHLLFMIKGPLLVSLKKSLDWLKQFGGRQPKLYFCSVFKERQTNHDQHETITYINFVPLQSPRRSLKGASFISAPIFKNTGIYNKT